MYNKVVSKFSGIGNCTKQYGKSPPRCDDKENRNILNENFVYDLYVKTLYITWNPLNVVPPTSLDYNACSNNVSYFTDMMARLLSKYYFCTKTTFIMV